MNYKNILLVDDSLLTSQMVSKFLREHGYTTEFVATGEAAIEKACSGAQFDLIIMDIELAGSMNGIDTARHILAHMDIPVIFLTAHSSLDILNKIKEIQAYGFVLKGMDKFALLSTIEMAYNLHHANAQTREFHSTIEKAQEELETSRKQYFELTENAPVGIIKCDANGTIAFVNQKALEILGSPGAEETKKINLFTFPPLVACGFSKQLKLCLRKHEHGTFEINYTSKWGKQAYIRLHIKPLTDEYHVQGAQLIIDDITEKKYLEEELRTLSLTDPLTGAYNRRYFIQKLEEEIARTKRQQDISPFCIVMLDVDHFKSINDSFGHHSGDLVLKQLTAKMKKRIRKTDCFARWGGEEFMILLPDTQAAKAMQLIENLRIMISKMDAPMGQKVTASFGVVEYCSGDTVDSMIQKADHLMYAAKKAGRNCVCSENTHGETAVFPKV